MARLLDGHLAACININHFVTGGDPIVQRANRGGVDFHAGIAISSANVAGSDCLNILGGNRDGNRDGIIRIVRAADENLDRCRLASLGSIARKFSAQAAARKRNTAVKNVSRISVDNGRTEHIARRQTDRREVKLSSVAVLCLHISSNLLVRRLGNRDLAALKHSVFQRVVLHGIFEGHGDGNILVLTSVGIGHRAGRGVVRIDGQLFAILKAIECHGLHRYSFLSVIGAVFKRNALDRQFSGGDGPRLGHSARVVALTGDGHGVGASILTRSLAANGIVTRR